MRACWFLLLWMTDASAEVPDAGVPDAGPKYVQIRAYGPQAIVEYVHFGPRSTAIDRAGERLLDEVAKTMATHPEVLLLELAGNADMKEDGGQRLRLSQQRAERVRDSLVRRGVSPHRLVARGYGDSRPLALNQTPEGRARNRRVEFIVLEPGKQTP